ncbi:MAG: hypothetical protein AB2808_09840, partial [Candidatus Sedimenticola endophacoides]
AGHPSSWPVPPRWERGIRQICAVFDRHLQPIKSLLAPVNITGGAVSGRFFTALHNGVSMLPLLLGRKKSLCGVLPVIDLCPSANAG